MSGKPVYKIFRVNVYICQQPYNSDLDRAKIRGGSQTNIENIKLEILNKTKLNFFTTRKGKKYSM